MKNDEPFEIRIVKGSNDSWLAILLDGTRKGGVTLKSFSSLVDASNYAVKVTQAAITLPKVG